MKSKILLGIIDSALVAGSFTLGYLLSKKIYTPKRVSGEIYIDYTENPEHPNIYLSALNPDIFKIKEYYIILGLSHIRK